MGTPIPPDPILIDPTKWYHATTQEWILTPGPNSCGGTDVGVQNCCKLGSFIIDWITESKDCTQTDFCVPLAGHHPNLLSFVGPFDTLVECLADL